MRKTIFVISIFILVLAQLACNAVSSSTQQVVEPTTAAVAPTAEANVPSSGNCSPLTLPEQTKSGYVEKITLAKDVEGEEKNPVGPTNSYGTNDVFHAVVSIIDAPADTVFKAVWYATDIGKAGDCNTHIDETDLTTDGTRNLDFNLTPSQPWPTGAYRVEIFVNGTLEKVVKFSVK